MQRYSHSLNSLTPIVLKLTHIYHFFVWISLQTLSLNARRIYLLQLAKIKLGSQKNPLNKYLSSKSSSSSSKLIPFSSKLLPSSLARFLGKLIYISHLPQPIIWYNNALQWNDIIQYNAHSSIHIQSLLLSKVKSQWFHEYQFSSNQTNFHCEGREQPLTLVTVLKDITHLYFETWYRSQELWASKQ